MAVQLGLRPVTADARRKLARAARDLNPTLALQAVASRHLNWINRNFRAEGAERKWHPLSPNTIAGRRGGGIGAKALRDIGQLAQSFQVLRGPTNRIVEVGSRDKKAAWHHFGTRPRTIVPVRARVLRFVTADGVRFARSVRHPGIPARPLLPSRRLATTIALRAVQAVAEKATRDL